MYKQICEKVHHCLTLHHNIPTFNDLEKKKKKPLQNIVGRENAATMLVTSIFSFCHVF